MIKSQDSIFILHSDTPAGHAATRAAETRGLKVYTFSRKGESTTSSLDDTQLEHSVKTIVNQFDKDEVTINYLITCPYPITLGAKKSDWDFVIERNLKEAALFCYFFGKKMMKQKSGRIVQLINNVALDPMYPDHMRKVSQFKDERVDPLMAYTASMAGLLAISRHLAVQFSNSGVLINNITFGPLLNSEPDVLTSTYLKRIPLGRVMTQDDLSNTIDLLLDPNSSYLTGQNIVADGGVSIW